MGRGCMEAQTLNGVVPLQVVGVGVVGILGVKGGHFVMVGMLLIGTGVWCWSLWLVGLYDPCLDPVPQNVVPLGSLNLGSTLVVPHGAWFGGTCRFSTVPGSQFGY